MPENDEIISKSKRQSYKCFTISEMKFPVPGPYETTDNEIIDTII